MKDCFGQQEGFPVFFPIFIICRKCIRVVCTSKVSHLGPIIHCARQHPSTRQRQPLIVKTHSPELSANNTRWAGVFVLFSSFLPRLLKRALIQTLGGPCRRKYCALGRAGAGVCKSKPCSLLLTLEQALCRT